MANLIITIISIALVAVAAIMGAYYGGTAFVQGQAKAYANSAVSQGDQISAAWTVYTAQTGASSDTISLVSSLLSAGSPAQSYLASVPVSPPQVTNSTGISAWTIDNLASTGATSGFNGVYFQLSDDSNGVNTCTYVSQIAAGASAGSTPISTSVAPFNFLTNYGGAATRKFDCVFYDATSTLSVAPSAASSPKFVYYRTF
jgi:hypothetical protein